MDTIESFSEFLRKIGVPNFLVIGIVIIVIWLFVSGIRKGLRKRGKNRDSEENEDEKDKKDENGNGE
jgi:Na+/H+ antiporter NhaD/arsenite permease-like protein